MYVCHKFVRIYYLPYAAYFGYVQNNLKGRIQIVKQPLHTRKSYKDLTSKGHFQDRL